MPNRFTAVPRAPAPPTGRAMAPVVAVADLFMGLMLSRPGGLSLRTAWVTPGTLLLAGLYTPVSAILAVLLIARGSWPGSCWRSCCWWSVSALRRWRLWGWRSDVSRSDHVEGPA